MSALRPVSPRKVAALVIAAAAATVVIAAPPRVGMLALLTAVMLGLVVVHQVVADVNRRLAAAGYARRPLRSARRPGPVRFLETRMWNGFATIALQQLEQISTDPSASPHMRSEASAVIAEWHSTTGHDASAYRHTYLSHVTHPHAHEHRHVRPPILRRGTSHVDVAIMSNLTLPGGTTGSNIAEIEAQTRAGLRTGLIHHPIFQWNVTRPVNPKILEHVDDDQVRLIDPGEHVTCDLLIIRAPKLAEHLLDDLPTINAARTIFVINQTPRRGYGAGFDTEADEPVWDIELAYGNLQARFGDHTWYPIGPRTRDALLENHADAMRNVPLADDDWLNIIDVDAWQREGRRPVDGTVRIGRHSRDHWSKWPETPDLIRAVYPDRRPYEVHVLGGADSAKQILGRRPRRWTIHKFNSVSPREFLHGLDVYAYYAATGSVEAFGRAPLEALATGLPTILPPQFADLFGSAAVYAAPEDVLTHVDAFMADDELYARRAEHAQQTIRHWFGYEAHLRRLADLGVGAAMGCSWREDACATCGVDLTASGENVCASCTDRFPATPASKR